MRLGWVECDESSLVGGDDVNREAVGTQQTDLDYFHVLFRIKGAGKSGHECFASRNATVKRFRLFF